MPFYHVKIIDKSGKLREYNRQYSDIGTLKNDVRAGGCLLVEFKEKKKKKNVLSDLSGRIRAAMDSGNRPAKEEDIYNLFYELGIILNAGVPIMRAIAMIKEETGQVVLKKFLEHVAFYLKEGKNLSDILEMKESARFYRFTPYVPIIRMGEKTGRMGESFLNISAGIEKWMKIKNEIVNALIYPLILLGTSLVAVYIMMVYVIPRFEPIVQGFKITLPTHTRVLFAVSTFFNNNQEAVVFGLIILLLALLILSRSAGFKEFCNRLLTRLPIVKGIKFSSDNLHFLNSLSNLLSGGVPILAAMNLANDSFASLEIRGKLNHAIQGLRKGSTLAAALKETDIFPEIVPNMIRVGEESGTLPEVLQELYKFMSQRFLKSTKKYMNLLEPLVILLIALFIGMVIMTIIPIILNISDVNF